MNERDSRYRLRPGERTTVELPERTLRIVRGQDEPPASPGEPASTRTPPMPFGDVELEVERDGVHVVLWVADMPLLTASLEEAMRLSDVLRSIVGRP